MKEDNKNQIVFDGQRDDEIFLFMFRRHIIAMRKGFYGLLIIFLLGCLPTFIFMTFDMLWFALGGFVLGLMVFFYHYISWYFSVYIVTDERIRQITQKGLFGKNVFDLPLNKIQTISFSVKGMSGEIFGFGTITIQTIVGDLIINNAAHPEKIYNELQNAISNVEFEEEEND